jgi:hypothetical protein
VVLVHTVLIQTRADAPESALIELTELVRALAASVAGPDTCAVGPNVTEEPLDQGFDFGFVIRFPNRAALDAYHVNPAHFPVSLAIRDLAQKVLVFDLDG